MRPSTKQMCVVGLAMGLSACWVKEEVGKRMQADIVALQVEMDVVKKAHANEKKDLQRRIKKADQKIAELVKIIEEYRRATGRNAADFGVDIERLKSQLMEMRGELEVSQHRLGNLENRLSGFHTDLNTKQTGKPNQEGSEQREQPGLQTREKATAQDPLSAIQRPKNRDDFYKLAYSLLETGQVVAARLLFQEFLEKWSSDAYSDNALYWIAESYYVQKNYRQAALTFQKVRNQYPKGDKAPDALLKLGYCFYAMKRFREALPFLQQFVQAYPKSRMVVSVRKKIREASKKLKKEAKSR